VPPTNNTVHHASDYWKHPTILYNVHIPTEEAHGRNFNKDYKQRLFIKHNLPQDVQDLIAEGYKLGWDSTQPIPLHI